VGKSENVMKRYEEHMNGRGSAWTRKYAPVSLEKTIENASPFEEDKVTKEYMAKYGIENVRGGSYVEIELSEFHIEALKMEIWAAKGLCTQCGRPGHFVKDCYAKSDASGNAIEYDSSSDESNNSSEDSELEWACDYCDRTFSTAFGCGVHEKSCNNKRGYAKKSAYTCYRCGRAGHKSPECYASTHANGYYIE